MVADSHLQTRGTSNLPFGEVCVRWQSLEKKAKFYPKAQERYIRELEGSFKVIPSNSLLPAMNGRWGRRGCCRASTHSWGSHREALSLPGALFPSLNPLIGRKFFLASNLHRLCANYVNMLVVHVQGQGGQLHLHDTMTTPRSNLSLLFLEANIPGPFFRPWLKMTPAPGPWTQCSS